MFNSPMVAQYNEKEEKLTKKLLEKQNTM